MSSVKTALRITIKTVASAIWIGLALNAPSLAYGFAAGVIAFQLTADLIKEFS